MKIAKSTRDDGNPYRRSLTSKEVFATLSKSYIPNPLACLSTNKMGRYISHGVDFVILNCIEYWRTRSAFNDIH